MFPIKSLRWTVAGALTALATVVHAQVEPISWTEPEGIPTYQVGSSSPQSEVLTPPSKRSTREIEGARKRSQANWKKGKASPSVVGETETLNIRPVPEMKPATSGLKTQSVPKLANGKSLADLNLAENQVVVLDEKGNIVESYIEGKDGKKTPVDVAKLGRGKSPAPKSEDVDIAARKSRTTSTSKAVVHSEPAAPKKGLFGRLFSRSKPKDAEETVIDDKTARRSTGSVLR